MHWLDISWAIKFWDKYRLENLLLEIDIQEENRWQRLIHILKTQGGPLAHIFLFWVVILMAITICDHSVMMASFAHGNIRFTYFINLFIFIFIDYSFTPYMCFSLCKLKFYLKCTCSCLFIIGHFSYKIRLRAT